MLPLCLALPVLAAPALQPALEVRVDPRFELFSIVFRLADFREYRMGVIADYNAAVDAHFGPFKDHAAVKMARELRDRVGYDAIPNLAVRVKDAKRFQLLGDPRSPAFGLDSRWEPATAERFLGAMAAFAKDTRAEAFFATQAPFYRNLLEGCRAGLVSHLNQAWFDRTFGPKRGASFTLCVAPLNGGANYGVHAPRSDGGEALFAILGTDFAGPGQLPAWNEEVLPTLVHEFLHSHTNPWVERHLGQLRESGEALNAPVASQLQRQAYGNGETALKESLVRAFTIRYFRDHGDAKTAAAEEKEHAQRGFYWVKPLADRLDLYVALPAAQRTLEAYTPQLVAVYRELADHAQELAQAAVTAEKARLEALYAAGPKLVRMEPANGATGIDSATPLLRLVFDRPMGRGKAIVRNEGPQPEFAKGEDRWSEDGLTFTFPMRLKPGTTYRFMLNADPFPGFQDREGHPMRPVHVTFTTR